MMEYNFDFHNKFGDYEKHRLEVKRKKKNSVIIVNKETFMRNNINKDK